MARRHQSLVHLSHDHHDGLLLARQILDERATMLPDWPGDLRKQASFILEFFRRHLRPHFTEEEELLFPLIRRAVPAAASDIDRLLNEHRWIEEFMSDFSSDQPLRAERLKQFGALLEGHIRKEERELFPLFEQKAGPEALAEAEAILSRGDLNGTPRASE